MALKDEYTFDFLELTLQHLEYEPEQALLANDRTIADALGKLG